MNATLQCKYNTQRILTLGNLNWVQHWVSRLDLLETSGLGTQNPVSWFQTGTPMFRYSCLRTLPRWRASSLSALRTSLSLLLILQIAKSRLRKNIINFKGINQYKKNKNGRWLGPSSANVYARFWTMRLFKKKYNSEEISLALIEVLLSSIRGRTQFVKYYIFPLTLPSRTYVSELGGANITCSVLSVSRGTWNCGGREKKSSDDWGSGEAGGASTHPIPLSFFFQVRLFLRPNSPRNGTS